MQVKIKFLSLLLLRWYLFARFVLRQFSTSRANEPLTCAPDMRNVRNEWMNEWNRNRRKQLSNSDGINNLASTVHVSDCFRSFYCRSVDPIELNCRKKTSKNHDELRMDSRVCVRVCGALISQNECEKAKSFRFVFANVSVLLSRFSSK